MLAISIKLLSVYEQLRLEVVKHFRTSDGYDIGGDLDGYPRNLINMVLAVEDQKFFYHSGIDVCEVLIAFKEYLLDDKPLRGASTISQQLIKNELLSSKRSLKRKLLELIMTKILENNFSKEFILTSYLNSAYLGSSGNTHIVGFKNASYHYFGKPLDRITLEQKAQLVAMLKGPAIYHPSKYPQLLKKRQQLVLKMFHNYQKFYAKYTSY